MNKLLFILFIIFIFSACSQVKYISHDKIEEDMEQITLKTDDGFRIEATYYKGNQNGIILIHMLGRDRNDWNDFALKLQKEGYSIVSVDMRGHGQSQGNFKSFSSEDFNNIKNDVKSAKEFLANKDVSNFAVIGASIGANTALNYAVEDLEIASIVLLSPGLDYRGVKTEDTIRSYNSPILIIASNEDTYSTDSSQALFSSAKGKKQIKIYNGLGHGTQMLISQEVQAIILDWLRGTLK